jgi:hypothetical protein
MKGEFHNKKVLVRGKEIFIGVDVQKESWHVTAQAEGEEVKGCVAQAFPRSLLGKEAGFKRKNPDP